MDYRPPTEEEVQEMERAYGTCLRTVTRVKSERTTMRSDPRCRYCAKPIEQDLRGIWHHWGDWGDGTTDCVDLTGNPRSARPTRQYEERKDEDK